MSLPPVVSRQEWLAARKALLEAEKDMTRARDALNTRRRQLPMVQIEKDYVFVGLDGPTSLLGLFNGRRQLIIRHFMFDPSWNEGCPSCTAASDEVSDGLLAHLHARDTSFVTISRAPLEKIEAYRVRKGWRFPWYSSFGSDFNYDFHVTLDASVAPVEFNYRNQTELEAVGMGWLADGSSEQPGHSMFLREGDTVFHTYSMFARGAESIGGSYSFLDLTALGRQEVWEKPEGRAKRGHPARPDFSG